MGALGRARSGLEVAQARRAAAERAIDAVWGDAARRTVTDRVLTPLNRETARFAGALERLDHELAAAVKTLGR